MSGRIEEHIRSHVWALVAVFVALTGTAIAAGGEGGTNAAKSANPAKQVKQLKRKLASVEQRLAALEGKPGPTSLTPSGPAGGELTGSYPTPTIGTVSGLDLASSTSPTAGINFGPDVNLYRDAANVLRTDDSLAAGGNITALGNLVVDGTAQLDDATIGSGFLRLRTVTVAPVASDCDNTPTPEQGRVVFNTATNELWICDPTSGWLQILAS